MKEPIKKLLFWTPRIMTILFAVFVSLFALDVFGPGQNFWNMLLGFLIHLIPTYLIVIALVIAWRWEWVGTILFVGLGVLYIVWARGQHWSAYLILSGTSCLIGLLFLASWLYRRRRAGP
ncbi:MAG: hypothetical protein JW934_10385 [Anaerolineae bacterium]|nr:hypothetical protein [Anaerolineae bacterium]